MSAIISASTSGTLELLGCSLVRDALQRRIIVKPKIARVHDKIGPGLLCQVIQRAKIS